MPGDPPGLGRLQELFALLLPLSAESRRRELDRICRRDATLGEQLAELLVHHDRQSPLLDADPRQLLEETRTDPAAASGGLQEVGPYALEERIGVGGTGWVFRARDTRSSERVALKVLDPSLPLDRRFQREAEALQRLEHPGIARLIETGTTPHQVHYIALELVEGARLDVALQSFRPSLSQRIHWLLDLCGAMAHAHTRGIAHRDLKPANVMITPSGEVRVLDFGIARLLEQGGEAITATHSTLYVTPAYASPEQLRGEHADMRSDVFSIGVIAFELLKGCHPFRQHAPNPMELVRRIVHDAPCSPAQRAGEELTPIDTVLEAALQKSPSARPRDAGQLRDRFRHALTAGGDSLNAGPSESI